MKNLKIFLWCFMGFIWSTTVVAQDSTPTSKKFEGEIQQGLDLMNKGSFKEADGVFRAVLTSVDRVPADLCFYFGKNSYHLSEYKQSIDWLSKYIELKGSYGEYFDQATEYISMAKSDYQASISSTSADSATTRPPSTISKEAKELNCEEHPLVTCPVCQGEGVIIQRGSLGDSIYKTCPYSDEYGRMTCEDYKLYVQGKLMK